MDVIKKVVIIGSGIAGLTAGMYCSRAELNPLIIEGNNPGGLLMLTSQIENYSGFPQGISGFDLVNKVREQAEMFGTQFDPGEVVAVNLKEHPFSLKVATFDGTKEIFTESLIIATGSSPRMLGLDQEKDLMGYGLSTCAVCDAAFYKGKQVVVVGGGDTAMEEAIYLTRFARQVFLVHRRDELRASKILALEAKENKKIHFVLNAKPTAILGNRDDGVTGIEVLLQRENKTRTIPCDGVFYAIGYTPNTKVFEGQLQLDGQKYIASNGVLTNKEGVFVAGDVMGYKYQQAIVAAGTGCMAALEVESFLRKL